MVHNSFTHPPTVAVEHRDLMLLRAPINPHKPRVRQRLILLFWMYGGRHDQAHRSLAFFPELLSLVISRRCHSALYWRSQRNFLPEVSSGSLARVQVHWQHSECRASRALRARGSPDSSSILL